MIAKSHANRPTASTRAIGAFGEQAAVDYLASMGYAIRERNWTIRPYEIDIIAQDGNTLVFVEVKTRATPCRPDQIINRQKQTYIMRAANAYAKRYNTHLKIRFDAIFIIGNSNSYAIKHIRNAFHPIIRTY